MIIFQNESDGRLIKILYALGLGKTFPYQINKIRTNTLPLTFIKNCLEAIHTKVLEVAHGEEGFFDLLLGYLFGEDISIMSWEDWKITFTTKIDMGIFVSEKINKIGSY